MTDETFAGSTLKDFNNEYLMKMIAPVVFLIICLLLGVFGNLTVLFIYGRKYSASVYRSIIWNLALADLMFCLFGITFDIARIFNYYTFKRQWICSICVSLLVLGIFYSSHLLILLSVHRFRQVCMSLGSQVTQQTVKFWIIGCFVTAIIVTSPKPALQFYEAVTFRNNVTGHTCPISSSNPSTNAVIYSYFSLVLFAFYTVILFVIYFAIGRRIYKQHKDKQRKSESATEEKIFSKMTKITLTVSVIFALSYFPVFLLQITLQSIHEDQLSSVEIACLRIVERCYVINHVANPFIYSVFDNRFRGHFKKLLSLKFRKPVETKTTVSATCDTSTSAVLERIF